MYPEFVLKIKLICLFLFFFPVYSFTQSESYYINQEGEKVYGEVFPGSKYDPYEICRFRPAGSKQRIILKAKDIQGYLVKGKRLFFSRQHPDTNKNEIVFWETLVSGEVSLHKFKEKFFLEYQDKWEQLYIREVKEQIDGKQYSGKTKDHMKILSQAFTGCDELRREILSEKRIVVMNDRNLVRLLKDYYKCTSGAHKMYNIPPLLDESLAWLKFKAGIMAGMSISKPDIVSADMSGSPISYNLENLPLLTGGLSLEIAFPRIVSRWSLLVAPYYQQNKIKGTGQLRLDNVELRNNIQASFNELSIPYGLKFVFRPSWNQAYIALGYTYHIYAKQKISIIQEAENLSSSEKVVQWSSLNLAKKGGRGSWLSLGVNLIQKPTLQIPFELRFIRNPEFLPNGKTSDNLINIVENSFGSTQFMIGVRF